MGKIVLLIAYTVAMYSAPAFLCWDLDFVGLIKYWDTPERVALLVWVFIYMGVVKFELRDSGSKS